MRTTNISPATAAARDLILDHLGRYTPVAGFDGLNERSLGQLASSEGCKILTAYMNNIRFRFKQHMDRVIRIALRMKEWKATLRHALRKATDARRGQVFKLHVHRPNRQVHDAIRTGNFHRHRGLIATRTISNPFRRNDSRTPGSDDDTPADDNGTGSDDDDSAAQTQHRYPTRRRTGCAPADCWHSNYQQQR
ncbi:hypothetical protein GGI23_007079 [Coemansia sp. RSA 2559]|nr:hypothetical protein GGI23_007079 [Coemansia sp. RSA 2559]KAJ2843644.1 hypothetical protein GGI22_007140 [Coemansia erecta]